MGATRRNEGSADTARVPNGASAKRRECQTAHVPNDATPKLRTSHTAQPLTAQGPIMRKVPYSVTACRR